MSNLLSALFNTEPTSQQKIEALQGESQGILSIFTNTKQRLVKVNDDILDLDESLRLEQVKIKAQRESLDDTIKENSRVINKIDAFLSE